VLFVGFFCLRWSVNLKPKQAAKVRKDKSYLKAQISIIIFSNTNVLSHKDNSIQAIKTYKNNYLKLFIYECKIKTTVQQLE
jgi:hypothetical protein